MIRLLRTNASRYQFLDVGQLKPRFDRLRSLLSNASPATRSVFAEPALVQDNDNIDWLSPAGGQPQALSNMSEVEADGARGKLDGALNDVLRIADEREATSSDDAEFLRSVATYPSDEDVFVLNGQPVIAAWGYGLAGSQPIGPRPAVAMAGASAAALASGDTSDTIPAPRVNWGRRLLLFFLLLIALSLLAWWYHRDFVWPPWIDYAAFHEAAGLNEQELMALADALENDIEAFGQRCTPPDITPLKREEVSLRTKISSLQEEIVDQGDLYDQHQIPQSQALRTLRKRVPPFNERITSLLRKCDAIAVEFEEARAEELLRQQEQERMRLKEALEQERKRSEKELERLRQQKAAQMAEEKRREIDEFDKRRAQAGGRQGDLTVTLLWNTVDDLDLHIDCPNRAHISYQNRSGCGGMLDVDKNARRKKNGIPMGPVTREPIENIFWDSAQSGKYRIRINLFKEGTRFRGARPFKIKVQKGEDVEYFEGKVSSGRRNANFDFAYP